MRGSIPQRSDASRRSWLVVACLTASALHPSAAEEVPRPLPSRAPGDSEAPSSKDSSIPIRFQGLLPGNVNLALEGKFRVEFRIYSSPQGGQPLWREEHEVQALKGQISIQLGTKTPIPMSIHESTYKWLGASVNSQREVFPRYPIVNVVYASPREALLLHEKWRVEERESQRIPDDLSESRRLAPAERSEVASTWKEALESARVKNRNLPDYQQWYEALERRPPEKSAEWTGHYEWVLPWVYDTASHGRYNSLFRGRFQGCDYSDLSPEKKYVYRVVDRRGAETLKERGEAKK